jgi:hypothetical protein
VIAERLEPRTIVLRDQSRSALMAGRKMLNVKPPVVAWMKRLMNAVPTMYQP